MEDNPLLSLPRPIIEALFKCAEREAQAVKAKIIRLKERVSDLRSHVKFQSLSPRDPGVVAAIDGSMSPSSSRRLGSEFAIYASGYMVFKDKQAVREGYYAGSLSWSEGLRAFRILLRLLMAYAERMAALEVLREIKPDYVILDGPFFYFKSYARYVMSVRVNVEGIETGEELIDAITKATLKLIESGRAICIIRRSAMRALDGWLLYTRGLEACIGTRDKHIMTMLMPQASLWDYSQVIGDKHPIHYAAFYREYMRLMDLGKNREELDAMKQDIMRDVEELWKEKFRLNLGLSEPPMLKRYYVRYSASTPPFEVEAPPDLDVADFASRMLSFYNPATGLPMPLDLVDNAISLPRGSTTMFTEEVEAMLIRDPEIVDKALISDYFSYLNPQKREYV